MSTRTETTWGEVIDLNYGRALVGGSGANGEVQIFGTNGPTGFANVDSHGEGPAVVVGRKGAYRGVHLARGPFYVIDTAYYVNPKVSVDTEWVYYALLAEDIQGLGSGSAIPSTRREDVYALPVFLPPLGEQIAIREVLRALDEKIAANQHLANVAHALARASVDQTCALGASRKPLAEVAHFRNRERIPLSKNERANRAGSVPYYGATGVVDYVDVPIFDEILVLVGEDGTVVNESGSPIVQLIWGPAWVNNHAHVLTGSGLSNSLLRHLVERANVADRITGAVQLKLSMGNLKSIQIEVPSGQVLGKLERCIKMLTEREISAVDENVCLAATRDELLPLLMSGKITVKDAEKTVEEVV